MTSTKRRTKTKTPGVFRSSSGSYEFIYRDSDGKLRSQRVDGGYEDAKAARADMVAKLHRGERVAPAKVTFGDFAEEWISSIQRRPRTIDAYRYALDRHLLPRFKHRKLASITTDDIARMVTEMQRHKRKNQEGYAPWTIQGTLSTLSGIMSRAKRRGLIPANPVVDLARDERPKQRGREKRVLSETEIAAVLSSASATFRVPIATMIFGGLRLGELLALRWQDVDTTGGFLRVRYQLSPKRELVELKTASGRRDVVLIPQLAAMLREHRMASLRKAASEFVFPSPDGRGRDQRSTARGVERALLAAKLDGLGISSHSFRHTYASLLIVGLKLDPVGVASQLGHSNPATTLQVYAHMFDKARHAEETRNGLANAFGHLLDIRSTIA